MAVVVLVMSGALLLFYIQTLCEQALKHQFSRPYFMEVNQAIQLEYPRLREALDAGVSLDYAQMRFALRSDFFTLNYLLKNGDPAQRRLARRERFVALYFRVHLFRLAVRHIFRLQEKEAVLKLASALQFFANSVGEKLALATVASTQADLNS